MPFTKIKQGKLKGKYRSPSGRTFNRRQVARYYARGGTFDAHADVNASCVHIHDATRFDPTGTTDLRMRLRKELDRKWTTLKRLTIRALNEEDILGLSATARPSQIATNPVTSFRDWFGNALNRAIVGNGGGWLAPYLDEAAARARQMAARAVTTQGPSSPRAVASSHSTVILAAANDLLGIVDAVAQQATRAVADGVLAGQKPRQIAGQVADRIAKVGITRSRTMAEYVIVRAYSRATLETYQSLGVTHVGTVPERAPRPPLTGDSLATLVKRLKGDPSSDISKSDIKEVSKVAAKSKGKGKKKKDVELVEVLTAGDDDVCQECEDISEEGPYALEEAQDLVPVHPRCRCAFVPADDERFASVHE